jgi:GDP-4-dehydro-6-deoxy-D-mannose reductase
VFALERGEAGEVYNICSGQGTKLSEIVRALIAASGRQIEIAVDPARVRANDVPRVVGDSTKLRRVSGWEPHSTALRAAQRALAALQV